MKKYFIHSQHDVFVDSYKDGELENVNHYSVDSFVNSENHKKAIEFYFSNVLFYDFKFELSDYEDGILFYSVSSPLFSLDRYLYLLVKCKECLHFQMICRHFLILRQRIYLYVHLNCA